MIKPSRFTLICALCVITRKFCCALVMIGASALCWDSFVAVKAKSPSYALSLPASGSLTANPSPIQVCDGSGLGVTTLSWTSTGTSVVEVHLDEPTGMLLATTGPSGTVTTGKWVGNATQFFLQDVSGGLPLSPENTLATVTVYLTGCSSPGDEWTNNSNNINNTNTGNVGIGTSGPVFKLDVRGGQINSAEGLCIAGDCKSAWAQVAGAGSSQWNNADSNIFFTTGNVGVGTGSPGARLDIGGGNLRVQSGTLDLNNQIRDDAINLWGGDYTLGIRPWTLVARTAQKFRFESALSNSTQSAYELGSWAGATFLAVKNDGNVGIGTTGPTSLFTTSQSPLNDATNRVGNYLFMESRNNTGSNIANTHTVLSVEGSTNNGYTWNGQTGVKSTVGPNWGGITDAFAFYANGRTQLNWHSISNLHNFYAASPTVVANSFISNSFGLYLAAQKAPNVVNGYGIYQAGAGDLNYFAGNVGIGTPPTNFKLDVNGEINATGFRINGTPISTGPSGAVSSVFGRTGAVVQQAGDYTWAQITKTSSSLGDLTTRSAGDLNAGTVPIARLGVSGIPDATSFLRGDNTWATVTGGPSQWTTTSGTTNISYNSGNVGIGTTTPQRQLHLVHQSNGTAPVGIDEYGAAPDIRFRRAEGTIANPSGVTFNKAIGAISAAGYGGANGFSPFRGLISFNASENWTDSAQGTFIAFYNTAAGGTTTSEKMRIDPSGNVGIGTTSPGHKLDVAGQIRSSTGGFIFPDGSLQTTAAGGAQSIFKNIANGLGTTQFSAGSTDDTLRFEGTGGTSVTFDNATKKVIINSSTSAGGSGPVSWAQVDKSVSSLADITTRNAGDLSSGTLPDARFPAILPTVSGANLTTLNASNLTSGIVPLARLGSGPVDATKFLRGDNTWAPVPGGPSQWTSGPNNISYTSGSVGIGTANPGFLLDVSGSTNNLFRVSDPTPGQQREYFATTTRTGTNGIISTVVRIADSRLIIDNNSPEGGNDTIVRRAVNNLIFLPSEHPEPNLAGAFMVRQKDGSLILHVDQRTNGNVGIGTPTPSAKLEVVGNVSVTGTGNITATGTIEGGNIKAKYQDMAEWVESSQELSAGTLVVLDHTKPNQVIASSQAYDTRVAGVISERPGIALGEAGDNKVLVATTGRVRLRVDASKGPIQIGDLLVTSEVEGVAMKSQPINVGGVQIHRPGTLIGKALEPLARGRGEILVLLSLQ